MNNTQAAIITFCAIIIVTISIIIMIFIAWIGDKVVTINKLLINGSETAKKKVYGDFINNFTGYFKDKEIKFKDGNPRNYDLSNIEVVKKPSKGEPRG